MVKGTAGNHELSHFVQILEQIFFYVGLSAIQVQVVLVTWLIARLSKIVLESRKAKSVRTSELRKSFQQF